MLLHAGGPAVMSLHWLPLSATCFALSVATHLQITPRLFPQPSSNDYPFPLLQAYYPYIYTYIYSFCKRPLLPKFLLSFLSSLSPIPYILSSLCDPASQSVSPSNPNIANCSTSLHLQSPVAPFQPSEGSFVDPPFANSNIEPSEN